MIENRLVVLDNTVLTNFALAECADLVMKLWGDALRTTPKVMAEHRRGVKKGSVPSEAWPGLAVVELRHDEIHIYQNLPFNLDPGERSCLAVVLCRGGILATDDLYARKAAVLRGVAVTGTVGILIGCIKRGLIDLTEGNRLLAAMIGHSYHSPTDRLDDFL